MEKTERRSRTHQTKAGMGREHDFVIDMRPCSLLDKELSMNDVHTEKGAREGKPKRWQWY